MKKRITKEDLNKLLDQHEAWLEGKREGKKAILDDYDLRNFDFSGRDLQRTSFRKCYLNYANFTNCNLHRADFYSTYCRYANFTNAKMTIANIRYSNFEKAIFTNAILTCNNIRDKYSITMKYPHNILDKQQIDSAKVIDRRGFRARAS